MEFYEFKNGIVINLCNIQKIIPTKTGRTFIMIGEKFNVKEDEYKKIVKLHGVKSFNA